MQNQQLETLLKPYENNQDIVLYTIQTLSAWQHFQKIGQVKADGRRVWSYFRPAYRWMIGQLQEKIPDYPGCYPIWAWYGHRPDLRSTGHLASGTPGILIKFKISGQQVLLSDFQTWHFVLNQSYLPIDEADDDRYHQSRSHSRASFINLPHNQKQIIIKSWHRIFDLRLINSDKTNYIGPVNRIQACLATVSLAQVLKIKQFMAR